MSAEIVTRRGGMSAEIVTMSRPRRSAHRIAALSRAEGALLRRNRIALLTALALPVAMVFALKAPLPSLTRAGPVAPAQCS